VAPDYPSGPAPARRPVRKSKGPEIRHPLKGRWGAEAADTLALVDAVRVYQVPECAALAKRPRGELAGAWKTKSVRSKGAFNAEVAAALAATRYRKRDKKRAHDGRRHRVRCCAPPYSRKGPHRVGVFTEVPGPPLFWARRLEAPRLLARGHRLGLCRQRKRARSGLWCAGVKTQKR
jgi:hypothetical protein